MFQRVRHHALITDQNIIYKRNTRDPVTITEISMSLNIILTPGEVPHEVPEIHVPELVTEHET